MTNVRYLLFIWGGTYPNDLMRENPFRGPLKGVGPENWGFFGPWNGNEQSEFIMLAYLCKLSRAIYS